MNEKQDPTPEPESPDGIPGFPFESILLSIVLVSVILLKKIAR